MPCSPFTAPSDTVCVLPERTVDDCPIIDLFVIHEGIASYLIKNGFKVTSLGFKDQAGAFQTYLAFSKYTSRREVGLEPIISTAINSVKPCYGTDRERLVLGDQGADLIRFPIEKEEPLVDCPFNIWKRASTEDSRFSVIGSTSLAELQASNGILKKLAE